MKECKTTRTKAMENVRVEEIIPLWINSTQWTTRFIVACLCQCAFKMQIKYFWTILQKQQTNARFVHADMKRVKLSNERQTK